MLTNTTFFCGPCAGQLIRGAPDCFGPQVGLEDPGVGRHANFVATGFNASYFRDGGRASNRRFGRISESEYRPIQTTTKRIRCTETSASMLLILGDGGLKRGGNSARDIQFAMQAGLRWRRDAGKPRNAG